MQVGSRSLYPSPNRFVLNRQPPESSLFRLRSPGTCPFSHRAGLVPGGRAIKATATFSFPPVLPQSQLNPTARHLYIDLNSLLVPSPPCLSHPLLKKNTHYNTPVVPFSPSSQFALSRPPSFFPSCSSFVVHPPLFVPFAPVYRHLRTEMTEIRECRGKQRGDLEAVLISNRQARETTYCSLCSRDLSTRKKFTDHYRTNHSPVWVSYSGRFGFFPTPHRC